MKHAAYTYVIALLVGLFCLLSCSDELDIQHVVDDELQYHFDSFEYEGRLRGLTIDLNNAQIHGFMETIDNQRIIGQCIFDDLGKSIVIDMDRWQTLEPLEKEFIVFHELGHCYLERGHTDTKESSGTCMSMMHSSTTACSNTYSADTRTAYLDELFLN